MRVYEHSDPDSVSLRSHPWTDSVASSAHRYRDLRAEPGLIRTALEDFAPWEAYAAVETHYALLEWLNGPESVFESNDCAFSGPSEPGDPGIGMPLQCSGRLMILYRDLPRNTVPAEVNALKNAFGHRLSQTDPDFVWGAVGVTLVAVRFTGLPVERQRGQQLLISFWAWGADVPETMAHLDRTLHNVGGVLRGIDSRR